MRSDRQISDEALLEKLHEHPGIRDRLVSVLSAVQDEHGDLKLADDAEMRLIEEIRRMGQEAMQAWAQTQVRETERELRAGGQAHREGKKKLCWHTTFGDIALVEPQYRRGSRRIRPFTQSAGVRARGCSRPLQRVMSDFAADVPFARAMDKLVEHYGIVVGESTIRKVTLAHAAKMHQQSGGAPQGLPEKVAPQQVFIAQMDGTMVPTVRNEAATGDRRKGKTLRWQEAKVCLAHVQGSKEIVYAATLQGDVDTAGQHLRACARRAGFGHGHRVHGVGDGAPWIASQIKKRFATQGSYLVDFYHVCEYLAEAAQAIESEPLARQAWLGRQRDRLKGDSPQTLLNTLAEQLEAQHIADEHAPVRRCHRYLSQRQEQLDYAGALREKLPIGSGEIESAHRYVIQKRLKLPGAWWSPTHVEHMLALRVNRANGEWNSYWATRSCYAEQGSTGTSV